MNNQRWSQVERLYHSAREMEAAERESFLREACVGDEELRREVESLLAYDTDSPMLIDAPALQVAARALAAERRDSMIGRTIGHYTIESWLGAGGMGEVYRAMDTRLDRPVAVKVLSGHLSRNADALARFEREAKAVAALSHPSILAIHDFGDDQGVAYAVTELLHGETLRARLNRSPMEWRDAVTIAIAIADGLAAAHAKGMTHRDLKPENIFLTEDERVKILDFGLAQTEGVVSEKALYQATSSALSEDGLVLGTVAYMSPEQAEGKKVDSRSDVFSFGSVLYEMITGRRTFRRENPMATLTAIIHEQPEPIGKISETFPPGLHEIIQRCLSKEPPQRFHSAHELLLALRKLQAKALSITRRRVLRLAPFAAAIAILLAVWAWASRGSRRWPPLLEPRTASLAVLPLTNLSGDPAEDYFADGMTDLLIADLAQISSLRVISRASVMQFKGTKKTLPEIARQLKVDAIVNASVLRFGDKVRITAELVDVSTDRHLWAKIYERKVDDVLILQAEVARAIAREIQARITPQESGRLSRSRSVNPAALEAYLKGRYYWQQRTPEPLLKSIEYFEQATRLDPEYGEAHAGLAQAWAVLTGIGATPWEEADRKARAAATKALALDATSAEAHGAMAYVFHIEWNWKANEEETKRATELNPGYVDAFFSRSTVLRRLGRTEESIAAAKRALQLDPLSMLANQVMANAYVSARQYDLAITHYQKGLELHPSDSSLHYLLGWAYVYNRTYDKGVEAIKKSLALDGIAPDFSPELAYIHAVLGKKEETRKILVRLLVLAKQAPVNPGLIALIYVGLGEHKPALEWLEKAYDQHSSIITWLKVDPRFDGIRQEPRFQDLMRRARLI